jgi:antitoxin PrlF
VHANVPHLSELQIPVSKATRAAESAGKTSQLDTAKHQSYIEVRIERNGKLTSAIVTSKGQITIPLAVRQRLGIAAGDRIEFVELSEGEFAIRPVIGDVRALKGMFKKSSRTVSTEQMRATISRRDAGSCDY